MSDLFFIAAAGKAAREHMQTSLIEGIPIQETGDLASDPAVRASAIGGHVFLWGAQPGPSNRRNWERMQPGDLGLVYSNKHFVLWSRVVAKRHDPALADRVWGSDAAGTWEYIYLLERPRALELPARVLFREIGYNRDFPMGFSYPADTLQRLIQDGGGPEVLVRTLEVGVLGVVPAIAPEPREPLTTPYRLADESASVAQAEPTASDPALNSAAISEHARIQNTLAARAQALGYECLSPGPLDPDFDLAWRLPDDRLLLVEVKTLTAQNERRQLRTGLGQVLEYLHRLRQTGEGVVGALAVSREPLDDRWHALLSELGVLLLPISDLHKLAEWEAS